jgi:tetratricopeptide (TPR) repeat protein
LLILAICFVAGLLCYLLLAPADEVVPEPTTTANGSPTRQLRQQAEALLASGRPVEAELVLTEYIQSHPEDLVVRVMLGEFYLQQGKLDKAEAVIDDILRISPDNAIALWHKGLVEMQKGAPGAEDYFHKAAAMPNAGPKVWGRYGIYLSETGKPDAAREYLDRAIDAGSEDPQTYIRRGQLAFVDENLPLAEQVLRRAVELEPRHPLGWVELAEVLRNSGRRDESVTVLRQGLRKIQSPARAMLLLSLGRSLNTSETRLAAAETFSQAAAYPSVQPEATLLAAKAYYVAGEDDLARKFITMAYQLRPVDPEVLRWKETIEDAAHVSQTDQGKPGKSLIDFSLDGLDSQETSDSPSTDAPSDSDNSADPLEIPGF